MFITVQECDGVTQKLFRNIFFFCTCNMMKVKYFSIPFLLLFAASLRPFFRRGIYFALSLSLSLSLSLLLPLTACDSIRKIGRNELINIMKSMVLFKVFVTSHGTFFSLSSFLSPMSCFLLLFPLVYHHYHLHLHHLHHPLQIQRCIKAYLSTVPISAKLLKETNLLLPNNTLRYNGSLTTSFSRCQRRRNLVPWQSVYVNLSHWCLVYLSPTPSFLRPTALLSRLFSVFKKSAIKFCL